MGNCNGIFSRCTNGEEVSKVDSGQVKQGLDKNKDIKRGAKMNDIEKYKLDGDRSQEPE